MSGAEVSCGSHDADVNPSEAPASVDAYGPRPLLDEPLRSSQRSRDLELSEIDVDAETLLGIVEEWKAGRCQAYSLEQVREELGLDPRL